MVAAARVAAAEGAAEEEEEAVAAAGLLRPLDATAAPSQAEPCRRAGRRR